MFRPVLVKKPDTPPIVAADLIAQTPALAGVDPTVVTAMIGAVTGFLDGWSGILGRCIVSQTWRQDFHCFDRCLRLPFPEARNAAASYVDRDGETQDVANDAFAVYQDEQGLFVSMRRDFAFPDLTLDRPDAVSVTFETGFGAADDVPDAIKQAIGMLVANMSAAVAEGGGLRSVEVTDVAIEQYNSPQLMSQIMTSLVWLLIAPYRRYC